MTADMNLTDLDKIEIAPFSMADIGEAYLIERRSFGDPWSEADFAELVLSDMTVFYSARSGARVVGYVGIYHILDEGQILNIAVSPEYRKRGIASALIGKIKEYARANGITFLTLEVRESNASARALYEKHGFYQVGVRTNYYSQPKENAILMNADIV